MTKSEQRLIVNRADQLASIPLENVMNRYGMEYQIEIKLSACKAILALSKDLR